MRVKTYSLLLIFIAAPASAEGYITDDPTLRSHQLTTKEILSRCSNIDLSHVAKSGCYYDQIKALNTRVNAEIKKQLIDANTMKAEPDIGGRTGVERARLTAAEIKKSQAAWSAYTEATCGAIAAQTERDGGNGGDLSAGACYIRHLVARLNELTH